MVFSSPIFLLIFLPIFLAIYYLAPSRGKARNTIALISSIFFFAWGEPVYVFGILLSIVLDYNIAKIIQPNTALASWKKKSIVSALICLDVLFLIYFKYIHFLFSQLGFFSKNLFSTTGFVSLLGISFITFHKISFIIDIYAGRAELPNNIFDYALYLLLFPQLIAGPIIRFHDIGEQIALRQHTAAMLISGLMLFSVGLAKKILIADPLGRVVDQVFNIPLDKIPMIYAWGGVLSYTFQIYFDFSGYSDMAIGLGLMMGFKFPQNFNHPYLSRSITEFWQRWHMTLSKWMKLYLYIPLGGNRVSTLRQYINLWVVFLISGLWHGANWTFIFWGAYHGFFLSLERLLSGRLSFSFLTWFWPLRQAITFLTVVVGWVFFRSATFAQAGAMLKAMFGITQARLANVTPWGWVFDNQALFTLVLAALICLIPWSRMTEMTYWQTFSMIGVVKRNRLTQVVALIGCVVLTGILLFSSTAALVSLGYTPFLYFRF